MSGGLVLALAAPAHAGDIYSWRTEDGGYAFADDPDAVPARYRDQVKVRRSQSIKDYERLTVEDGRAASRYEEKLAARLEEMRMRNALAAHHAEQAAAGSRAPDYVTVGSGARRGRGVGLSVPTSASDEALEVETVYMKRDGGMLTQPVRVTRRGGKVISIEKPRDRSYALDDAISERELDALLAE
jgi:hypothetical protein